MASRTLTKSSLGSKSEIPSLPNKKVPQNPRYRNVGRKVDTGSSISTYMQKMEQMHTCYKFKKDEIFKRIKCTTFSQLVLQVADDFLCEQELEAMRPEAIPEEAEEPVSPSSDTPDRRTLSDLVTGRGDLEPSLPKSSSPPQPPASPIPSHLQPLEIKDCPYLLLDVRESCEYEQFHVTSSQSYPISNLSKSCNYFTREIFAFKNKPGKIIVLCDMDESVAHQAATLFVQKDVENVFMLSGGMRVLYRAFSEGGFFSGTLSDAILLPIPGDKVSPVKPYKGKKPTAPALTALQRDQGAHKPWFTEENLTIIREQLDERLIQTACTSQTSQSSIGRAQSSQSSTGGAVSSLSRPSTKLSSSSNWKY